MGFLNLTMLFGLAAIAIPILIHLLHRRRYDIIDWGAMQFLQISQTKRRRLFIEELLLLLVRVGLIVLIVLALARPFADASMLGGLGGASNRLAILVFDGSYSMDFNDGSGNTPFDRAQRWANDFLAEVRPGDATALIVAAEKPLVVVEPTRAVEHVRAKIAELTVPTANGDWPRAVQKALEVARKESFTGPTQIFLLKDAQRFGWADADTLARWQQIKSSAAAAGIFVVDVQESSKIPPAANYALAPLQAGRAIAWAGQAVRFRTALVVDHVDKQVKQPRVFVEVDGKFAEDIKLPTTSAAEQTPLSFSQRFDQPGAHVVAVVVQPEPRDSLPGDNRQEITVEVVENFPVLLIDGDDDLSAKSSSYFLAKALSLAPEPKRPAVVAARVLPASKFAPADLADVKTRPRVLVLADVPRLTSSQEQAVRRFISDGGTMLVIAGARVEGAAKHYNENFFQDSKGWLPARLDQVMGDVTRADQAASLDNSRLLHPAMEAFRGQSGAFAQVRFPRWWKITLAKNALPGMASFSNGDPFLLEAPFGKGKVILCTAPLDRSWAANFPSVWEYPIFVHEVIARLADAGKTAQQQGLDLRESDLTPSTAAENARIAEYIPLNYLREAPLRQQTQAAQRADVWWLFLAGVVGFLCLELWLTRAMAKQATI